jgi:Sec-independent protein secretion pathway component TatC
LIGIIEFIKASGPLSSIPQEHILAAITGVFLGIVFYEIISRTNLDDQKIKKIKRILVLSGILFLLGSLILYKSLYPLNLNFSSDYLHKKVLYTLSSTYSFVPFSGFVDLFVYSILNILLFIPLGIVLNETERHIDRKNNIFLLVVPSVLLITSSFILKLINNDQIPLLLEVPIYVLGVFSGYFIWYGFRKEE